MKFNNFSSSSVFFQDIRFSIVTGESRNKFGVDRVNGPVIRMYLWNETVEYENGTWTPTAIENWALQTVHRVALWMTPSGYKSISLSSFFSNGPVLLFVTPRNMLKESTDAMEMMRQIGMEYFNCNRDTWIREMVRQYLPEQRRLHQEEWRRLKSVCQGIIGTTTTRLGAGLLRRSVTSVTFANLMNGSVSERHVEDICQLEGDSVFAQDRRVRREEDQCEKGDSEGECGQRKMPPFRETSMWSGEFDRRAPENLQKQMLRRRCEFMLLDVEQGAHQSFLGQAPFDVEQLQGIEALGCAGNRSLQMMLMDSGIYHVFAERLGVDIGTTRRRSAVFIVDPQVSGI